MFEPIRLNVLHVALCYEYVERQSEEMAQAEGQRVAQVLQDEFLRLGGDTGMAFVAKPVVGATMGAVLAVEGYFQRIREICDRYGVLLIQDGVMCGMGRTGHLLACDDEAFAPLFTFYQMFERRISTNRCDVVFW